MMKRILLPTDFSENSLNAIRYAMAFFKNSEVDFFVLNVQKTSNYTTADLMSRSSGSTVYRAILDDNKKSLNKFIEKLKKECVGEKYTFHGLVDFDVFTDAMQQAVVTKNIDLIIMGTNGATGAKEVLFGSNTLNVIRQVNCPLIAVPEAYTFKDIKNVLFSINYQGVPTTSIAPLIEILKLYKATLKVLDVKEENIHVTSAETEASLKDLLGNLSYDYYLLSGIPIPIAIDAFEQLFPVDLHALIVEQKSFLDRFVFGSETSAISYNSRVPLLILRL
ncbi:universal stress protein [Altibacter sp.]|uniref:universal stress protein n=1 Tax=Altibacter sp. TaxID=2024823 RepID=UPI0025C13493|nr:universal stress protein [Altibacter sp.]